MNILFPFTPAWRTRRLTTMLSNHGRTITVEVLSSETLDDVANHPADDQRYIHVITATWTDPASGKAYAFHRRFRSWRLDHFRRGDLVKVIIDPYNAQRYLVLI